MEKLMGIDSDYWSTFLGKDEGEDLYRDSRWVDKSIRVKLFVMFSMLLLCVDSFTLVSLFFSRFLSPNTPDILTASIFR